MKKEYRIIGLMSGTSMDGLDISYCSYTVEKMQWDFSILNTKSIPYPKEIYIKLLNSVDFTSRELLLLDKELGLYFSQQVNLFIEENKINRLEIDVIASHGHTIFHQPELGYTYQISCGETIAFHTGIKVVNDFRQKDVIAGGQGAPLVPIGDFLLFQDKAEVFLNLGGFANCSYSKEGKITAFDISPANLPLNRIVQKIGLEFDENGELAKKGIVDEDILHQLNTLPFYSIEPPKSLGTEWLNDTFTPLIESIHKTEDQLATVLEHISFQIGKTLEEIEAENVYITGGGVKNSYLIQRISNYTTCPLIVPSDEIIDFKEAIIFGFLGALYFEKTPNTLSKVTGAQRDVIGGVLHIP